MTGLHLAQYRIDAELGRGGMGIVYRATDTKLDRTVALKVLPAAALASDDDRARFLREAKAAAQLSHLNVCHVYQVDEAMPLSEGGERVTGQDALRLFIAMEYIEGETVRQVVDRGPMKLLDAVSVAGQVAEALKDAHAKQIVHRDIKSANVMLTSDGVAKVLDFGLAKTAASTMLTRQGSTLGTVAYMSPEQARGQEVDGRSDLYSLGTMLYEMVAGRLPFSGEYEQAVLYGIMNEPPEPLTAVRMGVPMELERIVAKLLAKEADYRYQTVGDLLADLKTLDLSGSGMPRRSMAGQSGASAEPLRKATLPNWGWGAIAGALAVGALGMWLVESRSPLEGGSDVMRFEIDLPDAVGSMMPAWSADGGELYYVASAGSEGSTEVRRYSIETGRSVAVAGTAGAAEVTVSPDDRWLAFKDARTGRYRRAIRTGGEPSDIPGAESPASHGRYGADGRFYFTDSSWEIASVGEDGDVTVHTRKDSSMLFPVMPLPTADGRSVFFSNWEGFSFSTGTYRLVDADPGYELVTSQYTFIKLLDNGYAVMIPAGQTNQPAAVAPIDTKTGSLLAAAVPVARMDHWGMAVSRQGHLVYRERVSDSPGDKRPIYRIGSDGIAVRVADPPDRSHVFAAARARNAVAIESSRDNSGEVDLYVLDLDTGVLTRLTRDGNNQWAEWSPDDRYVYWRRMDEASDGGRIMRRRADASEPAEVVLSTTKEPGSGVSHPAITSDGSTLLFTQSRGETGYGLYRIPLRSELPMDPDEAVILSDSRGSTFGPDPSPDGRYVTYRSESAIMVTSMDGRGEIEITSDGAEPVWSPDGRWIYFHRAGRTQIYRVAVSTDPVFAIVGSEELVFRVEDHLHMDLGADGTMLVAWPEASTAGEDPSIWLVFNFAKEAERIAPHP